MQRLGTHDPAWSLDVSHTPRQRSHDEASAPRNLEELLAAIEALEAPSGRVRFEDILELALMARDGLLALITFVLAGTSLALVGAALL
ncbi:hypothetical protein ACR80S_10330 [Halomonas sp. MA07-2]|uniref:hypothetical protein n=1 Tax=Halomonas sp. RA08-2 TaxID=3440842 RepID=UPI003EED3255